MTTSDYRKEKLKIYSKKHHALYRDEDNARNSANNKKHPEEMRARTRKWQEKNPERADQIRFRARLKREFGMTPEEYDLLYTAQGGKCAICERHQTEFSRRLAVDHDHDSGKIRGLLCTSCNNMLGFAHDDKKRLRRAIEYMDSYEENK